MLCRLLSNNGLTSHYGCQNGDKAKKHELMVIGLSACSHNLLLWSGWWSMTHADSTQVVVRWEQHPSITVTYQGLRPNCSGNSSRHTTFIYDWLFVCVRFSIGNMRQESRYLSGKATELNFPTARHFSIRERRPKDINHIWMLNEKEENNKLSLCNIPRDFHYTTFRKCTHNINTTGWR